jgi:hypothetical protein
MAASDGVVPSSFRDPSGFLFVQDGSLFRQVNRVYQEHYDHFVDSGLCESLVDAGFLVSHAEVGADYARTDNAYKVLRPELIPFISYPYEWCFSQLKDAALTTLKVQRRALDFGMTLKDSSAYNMQFMRGRPVLVDTLSFERYQEGQAWVAYRQFCQHFLAPLALMAYKDIRLNQLSRVYIDGVPLDLASSLLPLRTWLRFSLASHIHLHARSQRYFADKSVDARGRRMSHLGLLGVVDNLESAIRRMAWRPKVTEWADYYEDTSYSADGLEQKKRLVAEFLDETNPEMVWDLGANTGLFSRIASDKGIRTISFDLDPGAVEINYLECVEKEEANILPLLLDLTNPSPNTGWENEERMSILERAPADTALALALIHHLAISNNVPLARIAGLLTKICRSLIIEFVPKSDPQVQRLLLTREDVFPGYTKGGFESAFGRYFTIQTSQKIRDTERMLYLMRKR